MVTIRKAVAPAAPRRTVPGGRLVLTPLHAPAFLVVIGLLCVIALQVLWLTSDEGRRRHRDDN